MIRAAFFDIDGTLLSPVTGEVPQTAISALHKLQEQGIYTFIATGRSACQLDFITQVHDFDGFVTINGQHVTANNKLLVSNPIDPSDVEIARKHAEEGRYPCFFLTPHDFYIVNETGDETQTTMLENMLAYEHIDRRAAHEVVCDEVYQMGPFLSPEQEHILLDETKGVEAIRWCDLFCDVLACGGDKKHGIQAVLDEFGLNHDEVIAFGDGGNDIGMFDVCGTSVVMGSAAESVKAHADYITDAAENDGIANALKHFGLI